MPEAKYAYFHLAVMCSDRIYSGNGGRCECGVYPKSHETRYGLVCTQCDSILGKNMKCPKCGQMFKKPSHSPECELYIPEG